MAGFAVIIPAAGNSSRFGGKRKKPFEDLNGRPVWLRTVDHFASRDDVTEVVLVLAEDDMEEFRERFRAHLAFISLLVVAGGDSRAESVWNGIQALQSSARYIAVHDAARPVLSKAFITSVFEAAKKHKAVIPGLAVSSTVKEVDQSGVIARTVDRENLRLAQTPQVFERGLLQAAYEATDSPATFTDEASLVEASGQPVFVCDGAATNIKITTREDLELARLFLDSLPGHGSLSDVTPFSEDRFLDL